jgi:hypothetical protein
MKTFERSENKKARKSMIYELLILLENVKVEVRGIEPLSKHILQKLSTCLVDY